MKVRFRQEDSSILMSVCARWRGPRHKRNKGTEDEKVNRNVPSTHVRPYETYRRRTGKGKINTTPK